MKDGNLLTFRIAISFHQGPRERGIATPMCDILVNTAALQLTLQIENLNGILFLNPRLR